MSYTDAELKSEIESFVLRLFEQQGSDAEVPPDWVAMGVIAGHIEDFRKHEDFTTNAVWGHVRKLVGAHCRNMRLPENDDAIKQGILAGFEKLQAYYEVERTDGNTVRVVRVKRSEMTAKERRQQADMIRRIGMANIHHADSLDRETDELIAQGLLDEEE